MSKLPKLKTGRTEEKLENSAFSLNVAPSLKKFRITYDNMGKMSVAMEHYLQYTPFFTLPDYLH